MIERKGIIYRCPVCQGPLGYERLDDGMLINKITDSMNDAVDIFEVHNKSNGYDLVFCWNYRLSHKIPDDLRDATLDLIRR